MELVFYDVQEITLYFLSFQVSGESTDEGSYNFIGRDNFQWWYFPHIRIPSPGEEQ